MEPLIIPLIAARLGDAVHGGPRLPWVARAAARDSQEATMTPTASAGARFDARIPAVVVTDVKLTHPTVTTEALRWSTGARGPAVAAAAAAPRRATTRPAP